MPVPQVIDEIPDGFLGRYPEGIVETDIGGENLQIGTQHQQRLMHGFHDVLGVFPCMLIFRHRPLQILILPVEPALQGTELQLSLNASIKLFPLKRFCHIVHAPHTERFHLVNGFTPNADENDRNLFQLRVGLELFAEFIAVHVMHIDIQQNQVGGGRAGSLQHQFTAENRSYVITSQREHSGQEQEIGRRVVHDQDILVGLFSCFRHGLFLYHRSILSVTQVLRLKSEG